MRLLRIAASLTLLSTLTLAGCGYQLRGITETPPELSPMYVQAPRSSRTAAAVRSALQANGVELAVAPKDARTIIRVLNEEEDERVAAGDAEVQADAGEHLGGRAQNRRVEIVLSRK